MLIRCSLAVIACVVCIVFSTSITIAAECQQQDNFSNWLEHFKQEATSQGISQQTVVSALNGITYDPAIIAHDHSQNVFQQSFEQFSGRTVSPDRLRKGANMLKRYGSILGRIDLGCTRRNADRDLGNIQRCAHWQHWPMIVVAQKNFGPNWLMRFVLSSVATSPQTR